MCLHWAWLKQMYTKANTAANFHWKSIANYSFRKIKLYFSYLGGLIDMSWQVRGVAKKHSLTLVTQVITKNKQS